MKQVIVVAAACLALGACAEGYQRSPVSRRLDSGVTSDTGGGQSSLHDIPDVGVTNGTANVSGIRNKGP